MAMNNASKTQEDNKQQFKAEKRRTKLNPLAMAEQAKNVKKFAELQEGNLDKNSDGSIEHESSSQTSSDSSQSEDDDDGMTAGPSVRQLNRVNTKKAMSTGIPGGYEDFSYQEAKKVVENIKRTETYVMNKLKIGLAKRVLNNKKHEEL